MRVTLSNRQSLTNKLLKRSLGIVRLAHRHGLECFVGVVDVRSPNSKSFFLKRPLTACTPGLQQYGNEWIDFANSSLSCHDQARLHERLSRKKTVIFSVLPQHLQISTLHLLMDSLVKNRKGRFPWRSGQPELTAAFREENSWYPAEAEYAAPHELSGEDRGAVFSAIARSFSRGKIDGVLDKACHRFSHAELACIRQALDQEKQTLQAAAAGTAGMCSEAFSRLSA